MGKPAARMGDMHICPLSPPVPHVGGLILPPVGVTVFIGNQPAARLGDLCGCVGAIDSITSGSETVFICGKPAARLGDTTAHGGSISAGSPSVLIG